MPTSQCQRLQFQIQNITRPALTSRIQNPHRMAHMPCVYMFSPVVVVNIHFRRGKAFCHTLHIECISLVCPINGWWRFLVIMRQIWIYSHSHSRSNFLAILNANKFFMRVVFRFKVNPFLGGKRSLKKHVRLLSYTHVLRWPLWLVWNWQFVHRCPKVFQFLCLTNQSIAYLCFYYSF